MKTTTSMSMANRLHQQKDRPLVKAMTKEIRDGILVLDFRQAEASGRQQDGQNRSLHPLGPSLRRFLMQGLLRAQEDATIQAVIITGGPHHFSSGADLTEMAAALSGNTSTMSLEDDRYSLRSLLNAMEQSRKPLVAAVAGTCFGGGLELTLGCTFRVTTASARWALPEVMVGLLPGEGGTQRLPRLIGLAPALRMILTGQTVTGTQACKMHLADAVVEEETAADPKEEEEQTFVRLMEQARRWARWAAHAPPELWQDQRLCQRPYREAPAQAHVLLQAAALQLPAPERGGEGLWAAWRAVRSGVVGGWTVGRQTERDLFFELLVSDQGRARRHVFFAVRAAQRPVATLVASSPASPGLSSIPRDLLSSTSTGLLSVGVVGAGKMGSGIALVLLRAGFRVVLVDIQPEALQQGRRFLIQQIQGKSDNKKQKPSTTGLSPEQLLSQLNTSGSMEDLKDCLLVVEAVVENMRIKQSIFSTLNRVVQHPQALLLTNTSTLNIDDMASVLNASRRPYCAGWHFFMPAHVMKLVEVVQATATSTETVALLQALTKKIGKTGVVVGNCDGFCGNRLLRPYAAETAMLLVEGGATIGSVDQALKSYFGMIMGPFEMADLSGNDIGYNIRKERKWVRLSLTDPTPPARPARYTELADDMVTQHGRLGQKAGKGWYNYDPTIGKGRIPLPSPEMEALVPKYFQVSPSNLPPPLTDEEIVARVMFPLVNEGFKCLEEGMARQPSDIDVVYVFGYGFPPWRGGPMYWADHDITLPVLLSTLRRFHQQFPQTDHYVPSALLQRCVELDMTVEEYYRQGLHRTEGVVQSRL